MQNTIMYSEEDMLPLSGIQHYAFCPQQWALIHVEQLWSDNHLEYRRYPKQSIIYINTGT